MSPIDDFDTYAEIGALGEVPELKEGTHVGRYQILGLIGKGGMGAVYKAYDPELDRRIAIKILTVQPHEGETASRPQARLMREAQALAKLSHPHVVSIFDVGTYEKGVYIAMEYVKGKTLREWLKDETPTQKDIMGVLADAGKGVHAAHNEGIVHRDFKPDNVIVGERGQVKVLDFGLARAAENEEPVFLQQLPETPQQTTSGEKLLSAPLTQIGATIGTKLYMAPEHFLGDKLDEKTDQFSFCVTLFEALYGQRPFYGETVKQLRKNITLGSIELPQEANVPKWIEKIVRKGLSVSKKDRYTSMLEILDALEHDPVEEKRKRRESRNRRILIITLAILTIALPIGVWYGLHYKTVQRCKATQKEFVGIWDAAIKNSIYKAFLDTKKPFAQRTWERVEQTFDKYVDGWKKIKSDICESRHVSGTQSAELFDLSMGCLKTRKQELKVMTKIFTQANDKVVEKAIQASSSLHLVSLCADEKALRAPYHPPKTMECKKKVASIREKLTEAEVLAKTGKFREGLDLAKKLKLEANAVDYQPVQAEVLYYLGSLLERTAEYRNAENTLYEAARLAGQSGYGLLAAKAMTTLVYVVGYSQEQHDDGLLLGKAAEVLLGVAHADEILRSELSNNLGVVFRSKGDYVNARLYYRKALAIVENSLGPDHPHVAVLLFNLGGLLHSQGEPNKAMDLFRRSLRIYDKALGPNHPKVSWPLFNMGNVYKDQGKYDKALEYHRKALAIYEAAVGSEHAGVGDSLLQIGEIFSLQGKYDKALEYIRKSLELFEKTLEPEHPKMALSLSNLGEVFLSKGMHQQAVQPIQRAVRICQKRSCQSMRQVRALFDLARALSATASDKVRAVKLANQAREIYEKTPTRFKKELADIDVWLDKHDS